MKLRTKVVLAGSFLALAPFHLAAAGPLDEAQEAFSRGDYSTAQSILRPLAEQGDPKAEVALGRLYASGRGVPQDSTVAISWFKKAADQGYAEGQFDLALMYEGPNPKMAVRLLKRSADQGFVPAEWRLGWDYDLGEIVAQDVPSALVWYRKAAEAGDQNAQVDLGLMYAEGRGVAIDQAEAFRLIYKAAQQGNYIAEDRIARMYVEGQGVAKDSSEAIKWYLKLTFATGYEAFATEHLADIYYTGNGVPQDYAEARRWYKRSAEFSNTESRFHLAQMCEQGMGGPIDLVEAYMSYLVVAREIKTGTTFKTDLVSVEAHLEAIAAKLTPTQISEAQRDAGKWAPPSP
jgi:TPR repeat protein